MKCVVRSLSHAAFGASKRIKLHTRRLVRVHHAAKPTRPGIRRLPVVEFVPEVYKWFPLGL